MKKAPLFILLVGYGNIIFSLLHIVLVVADSGIFNWQKTFSLGMAFMTLFLSYHLLLGKNWARLSILATWLITSGVNLFKGTNLSAIVFVTLIQVI